MSNFLLGEQVWIISFETEDEFFLVSKQTITDFLEDQVVECEDDFNTFHVSYDDIYKTKAEALDEMIKRLTDLRNNLS